MTTEYVPIACDRYSELEVLAMRRLRANVQVEDDSGAFVKVKGVVWTLQTRERAEYLIVKTPDGGEESLRLDRVVRIADHAGRELWRQNTDKS